MSNRNIYNSPLERQVPRSPILSHGSSGIINQSSTPNFRDEFSGNSELNSAKFSTTYKVYFCLSENNFHLNYLNLVILKFLLAFILSRKTFSF